MKPSEVDTIYERFTSLADRKKRIYDQDLIALLQIGSVGDERLAAEGAGGNGRWAQAANTV